MLKDTLNPKGEFEDRDQVLQEEGAARDQEKWDATKSEQASKMAKARTAREGAYRVFDYMATPEEKPGIGLGLTFDQAEAKVMEEMRGTDWDIESFNKIVKNLKKEYPTTKEAFSPEDGQRVFATEEDIASGGVVPTSEAPKPMDPKYGEAGRDMVNAGTIPESVYNYYSEDWRRIDRLFSEGQQVAETLGITRDQLIGYVLAWAQEVIDRRRKNQEVRINLQMLQGGTDTGSGGKILNVIPSN